MSVTYKSDRTKAISECKRLRKERSCPRQCDCWNPNGNGKRKPFCKDAWAAERGQ